MSNLKTELEVKFLNIDKYSFIKNLKSAGASLVHPDFLMKRVLFTRLANPDLQVDFIRIRKEFKGITVSAKVHADKNGNISDQKELEIDVSDFDKAIEIFKLAGLTTDAYQENYREKWSLNGAEIVIDRWPKLPAYIEIEAESEAKVKETAELLNLNWEDRRVTSVVYMYSDEYRLSIEDADKLTSNLTFEKDIFENLKSVM